MMRFRSFSFWHNEDGVSAVEFALVAPILIFLLVGMYDFGAFIHQQMRTEYLARSAAEYVVKGGDPANVVADVLVPSGSLSSQELADSIFTGTESCACDDGVEAACTDSCGGTGYLRHFYTAEITRTYTPVFPYPGLPETLALRGHARLQLQ